MLVPCGEMDLHGKLAVLRVMHEPGDRVCRVRMVYVFSVSSMSKCMR